MRICVWSIRVELYIVLGVHACVSDGKVNLVRVRMTMVFTYSMADAIRPYINFYVEIWSSHDVRFDEFRAGKEEVSF